ncbi:MAG: MFS transporter [Parcubacteria group bacterium]|nr:MFS transporter [Parcubacteria group bacterium]
MVAAAISLVILLNISAILNKIGNHKLILYLIVLEFISVGGLAIATSSKLVALLFILHQALLPIIFFSLDVFLENTITDETRTGRIRAFFLTLSNITLIVAPLIVSLLVTDGRYLAIYIASSLFLLPMFFIAKKNLDTSKGVKRFSIKIADTFKHLMEQPDIYNILGANFILQFFYAWVVIYTPIYLHQYIGFSWSQIGIMFTIMLLPFVLFEYPIGKIADKKLGEKEFLIAGFIIIATAVIMIPLTTTANFVFWTALLFLSRTGASFVEVTTESYFFKHVDGSNADTISFFRLTRPLSYITAPLIAIITFQFLPFRYTFWILGVIVILGLRFATRIHDTK